jgi:hypothetical protein
MYEMEACIASKQYICTSSQLHKPGYTLRLDRPCNGVSISRTRTSNNHLSLALTLIRQVVLLIQILYRIRQYRRDAAQALQPLPALMQ